jgi:phosphoribosylaminoimidazole-succinocarboxamide synthase
MRCKKAERLPIEWIVRGYLTGSGWKDYQKSGVVSGVELPPGLQHAAQFDPPILTATTKADEGHDEPISFAEVENTVGKELAAQARDVSLALYQHGHDFAKEHGIVIADTKFEFGMVDGELTLIDEVLTPDSSRFGRPIRSPLAPIPRATTSRCCATGSPNRTGTRLRRRRRSRMTCSRARWSATSTATSP